MSRELIGRPMEILLVEDSLSDAALTMNALEQGGVKHRMTLIRDGEEALEFLRRKGKFARAPRPDLILLDLNLPKVDGRELLAEVRGDSGLSSIPGGRDHRFEGVRRRAAQPATGRGEFSDQARRYAEVLVAGQGTEAPLDGGRDPPAGVSEYLVAIPLPRVTRLRSIRSAASLVIPRVEPVLGANAGQQFECPRSRVLHSLPHTCLSHRSAITRIAFLGCCLRAALSATQAFL